MMNFQKMNFLLDDVPQLIKALWYKNPGIPQSLVFGHRCFWGLVGTSSCMAELDLKVAVLQNEHRTPQQNPQELVFSTANEPQRQTWWHRFQCTSTRLVCWSCPLWCLGRFCTPQCLRSEHHRETIKMRSCLSQTGQFGVIPGGTPTSPSTTIIFIPGVSWYRRTWSMKVEPGYLDNKRKILKSYCLSLKMQFLNGCDRFL